MSDTGRSVVEVPSESRWTAARAGLWATSAVLLALVAGVVGFELGRHRSNWVVKRVDEALESGAPFVALQRHGDQTLLLIHEQANLLEFISARPSHAVASTPARVTIESTAWDLVGFDTDGARKNITQSDTQWASDFPVSGDASIHRMQMPIDPLYAGPFQFDWGQEDPSKAIRISGPWRRLE